MHDASGDVAVVASIERVNAGVRVYNINVLAPDSFFAGGYLVHNKEDPPYEQ